MRAVRRFVRNVGSLGGAIVGAFAEYLVAAALLVAGIWVWHLFQ
jgi:hypothetical protein